MKKSSKQRGRSHGRNNTNNNNFNRNYNVNSCFDSNGPGGRIRGNASQIVEKYLLMARDANSQNDRVLAENYYQYAEHYSRVINSFTVDLKSNIEEKKVFEAQTQDQITEEVKENNEDNSSENNNVDNIEAKEAAKSDYKKPRKRRPPKIQNKEMPRDMIQEVSFLTKQVPAVTE